MVIRKIALILVDGMRPDGLTQANTPTFKRLIENGAFTFKAQSVLPSWTLPCITSLILGVDPFTHGTLTNNFGSNAWDVPGLIDLLHDAGYKTGSFTNWEQLRDLSRPGALDLSVCINTGESRDLAVGESDRTLISIASMALRQQPLDFVFLYLGSVDTAGHMHGWMSPEYIHAIENADLCVRHFLAELPRDTAVFITADHGGIGKSHGSDSQEELTIPFLISAGDVPPGEIGTPVSILDIAPTIAACAGILPPPQWEGKALFFNPQSS
jgi:predicted AlkP superfamily pyrophosphatase or phosphodiesterase